MHAHSLFFGVFSFENCSCQSFNLICYTLAVPYTVWLYCTGTGTGTGTGNDVVLYCTVMYYTVEVLYCTIQVLVPVQIVKL